MLNICKADDFQDLSLVLGNGIDEFIDVGLWDIEENEDDLCDFAWYSEAVL